MTVESISFNDWVSGIALPIGVGPHIHASWNACRAGSPIHQAGAHANLAISNDLLPGLHTSVGEQFADIVNGFELSRLEICEEILPKDERGARKMTRIPFASSSHIEHADG